MENTEQKSFAPTEKMLKFFMDTSRDYAMGLNGKEPSQEEHFTFVCERMHQSEDKEIKIEFSRCLMYMGFSSVVGGLTKVIMSVMMKSKLGGSSLEDLFKG